MYGSETKLVFFNSNLVLVFFLFLPLGKLGDFMFFGFILLRFCLNCFEIFMGYFV